MIIVEKFKYEPLNRVVIDGKRHYDVDTEHLPSVTTVLSATASHVELDAWITRVGGEEAARIADESAKVGSAMHDNLERFALHGDKPTGSYFVKSLSNMIINKGLTNVDEVWGCEVGLYYSGLWAGSADMVGLHKSTPAIIDFKNARKEKSIDHIGDYFLQGVAYAEAHNHMFGTNIEKVVIMMACWTGNYLEFEFSGDVYAEQRELWYSRLHQYHLGSW